MVSEALAAIVLKPAAIVVIAVLIVAIVLTVVLSVLIKRRAAVQSAAARSTALPQRDPVHRAVVPAAPVDMQERLRRLTTVYDSVDETTGHVTPPAHGSGPLAPRGTGSLAVPPPPVGLAAPPAVAAAGAPEAGLDDATRFFGNSDVETEPDSTTFFGAADEAPDSTTFFGAESEPGAGALVAEDDGTRFFGRDDDGSRIPALDESGDAAPSGTQFFGLDEAEREPAPSETHFFTPDELDSGAEAADEALEGHTGMLRALPPTLKDEVWDDEGRPAHGQEQQDTHETEHEEHDLMASTGFLAALPPSTLVINAAVRDLMRVRLASITAPEVLALSVIDGTGRVLAGEGDENLAGELYALMDESGQGKAADIEQPVRLADDSAGVILLLPTGTDVLLGALVREAEDPRAMRDSLRGLAHEIGDAMRRAS